MEKFRVREHVGPEFGWVVANHDIWNSTTRYIKADGTVDEQCNRYNTEIEAQAALDLYLEKQKELQQSVEIRTFATGATRDTVQNKLDYVKALSPIVLRRYVQYLDKHRLQSDGSYRDFDNWKMGMPQETYLSSLGRHFLAVWLLAHGHTTEDNHGPAEIEDTLAAIIFNASGYLHELLVQKGK